MRAQYQKLLKASGGSEEGIKALLRKLVAKETLERTKEVLGDRGKGGEKSLPGGA